VLHAHLPFVRHPEHPRHLEEHWLFEAMTDCYLPLLKVLRSAAGRGSRFRLTLSLSPTLLSMLSDPLLGARYLDYLSRLAQLGERVMADQRSGPRRRSLTRFYMNRLERLRTYYLDELHGDLVSAWAALADIGMVEVMTTAATHGYLPLLRSQPAAIRAQLLVARDHFRDTFGQDPRGLWLPECGYFPGLERYIAEAGFDFCVLDAHGLQQARPLPPTGVYAPLLTDNEIAVFGRDPDSAREIWSPEDGYPGHPLYREYHRDLGFEGNADLLEGFLPAGVDAAQTGFKYQSVTGGAGPKAPYDPTAAATRARLDARLFVERRGRLLASLSFADRPPLIVAPYDAELFGHWWFEGPAFLDWVVRRLDEAAPCIRAVTLGEHLRRHGSAGRVRPAASSWGEQGYNRRWLGSETSWVYLHLHEAAGKLQDLLGKQDGLPDSSFRSRLLQQAARSLLLAQSSDWTFHLGRGAGSGYSMARLRDQLARFRFLTEAARSGAIGERRLAALEQMDNLFPKLDLRHFG
jgi:1,4-alpha-glucan branching enzyme